MKTVFILAVVLAGFVTQAQPTDGNVQKKMHDYVASYNLQGSFNGVVMVAEKGNVLFSEGFGLANFEWDIKNTPETKFLLASISKTFTAATVMKLSDQGKLSLDTKLNDILKWYRADTGGKITVRHLLNHTSGIPNYFVLRGKTVADVMKEFGNGPIDKTGFAQKYCQGDLEFEPGTKWNYNNSAYFLLGLVIEEVSGKSYEKALTDLIFQPLQMNNSGDVQPDPGRVIPNMATGYMHNYTDFYHPPYWNMSTAFAAGSLYSTVGDLLKYDRALYDTTFLSAASRNAMFTPALNNYGCGWEIREINVKPGEPTKKVHTHEGFLFSWHTRFYQITNEQVLIVVLSNGGNAPIEKMMGGIIGIIYGQPVENQIPIVANEIWKNRQNENFAGTISSFRNKFNTEPEKWDFSEYELNKLGYTLLQTNNTKAIAVFGLVTDLYPNSWNAWDSLGESLAAAGKKEEAILAYQKSVELNTENKAGVEMLQKLRNQD